MFKFKNTFKGFSKDIGKIKKIYPTFFSKTSQINNFLKTVRRNRYDYTSKNFSKFDLSLLKVSLGFGAIYGAYLTAKTSPNEGSLLKYDTLFGSFLGLSTGVAIWCMWPHPYIIGSTLGIYTIIDNIEKLVK